MNDYIQKAAKLDLTVEITNRIVVLGPMIRDTRPCWYFDTVAAFTAFVDGVAHGRRA